MTMQTAERKDFAANARLKAILGRYFMELENGPREGKKTAWCSSGAPTELLRALDFNIFYPENHGAMLGATRMATDLIPLANARGFSPDVCSYLTSDIGSYLTGETPLKKWGLSGAPKPDVLVFNTNQCRDVKDWFQFYSREFGVQCIGIHSPRSMGDIPEYAIDDVTAQTEALVEPLEGVAGQKLDIDKLREAIALAKRCIDLWKAVLDTAANVPSPLTFFDATLQMAPAVVLRGLPGAVEYYEVLLAELKDRVRDGVAAVEGEEYRIYWDGMPIWGKLSSLSGLFLQLRACIVASTYCNSWVFDTLDPDDPFRSLARAYSSIFICRSEDYKEPYIENLVERFQVDGILYHDSMTCPNMSNNRYELPQRVQAATGKPFLVINGDMNDLRLYSEEQTRTNIEAFVEQLAEA